MNDLNLIVQIVNKFGDHAHPEATVSNLVFFETPYIQTCIKKALASGRLSEAGMEAAKHFLDPNRPTGRKRKPKTLVHYY